MGQILTRVTQDVSVLNELFAQGVVAVLGDLFILFGIVGAMLWLDWRLALVTLTTVPLLVIATAIFRAKVRVSYRRVRTRLARINGFLQEHLQGLDVLKFFNAEREGDAEVRPGERTTTTSPTSRTSSTTRSSSRRSR